MWKRRPTFTLRTLLLGMAAVCCLAALLGYEVNWIRERRAFRRHPQFSFVESPLASDSQPKSPNRIPAGLSLLGERGVPFITMEVLAADLQIDAHGTQRLNAPALQNLLRAHALFPEAAIYATDESGDVVENLNTYWHD